MKQMIIFTDMDGTLLDKKYSFSKALPALKLIKKYKIPLIVCSSKTYEEIEYFRRKLKNNEPFITENGTEIYIPKNLLKNLTADMTSKQHNKQYNIIEIGTNNDKIKKTINLIKQKYNIITFDDMSLKHVAKLTGLPIKFAELSKKRKYDMPFRIENENDRKKIIQVIKKTKLKYLEGGLFSHITSSDKGKAVRVLIRLLKKKFEDIATIGIGDSFNDFEMLEQVDMPYLVQRPDRTYASNKYRKAEGIGPIGWNKIVKEIISRDLK